jgi:hypothetical protein
MKRILPIFCLIVAFTLTQKLAAQSKKEQIELLTLRVNSLNNSLDSLMKFTSKERNENYQKIQGLNGLKTSLENQISDLKKENEKKLANLNGQIQLLNDSVNQYKKELKITNKWLENHVDAHGFGWTEFEDLIIFSVVETKFSGGEPNDAWNGDYWMDTICTYLYKDGDDYTSVQLEDCFNENKQALLLEINKIAKQQFKEDYETVRTCGGELKLPLTFQDLELHFDGEFFRFEYDVGVWKGNVCGMPRDEVSFSKDYIKKFLK